MLFNSLIFMFLFLPVVLLGWYIIGGKINKRCAVLFLTVMSLWFYGYANPCYLILIVASILINHLCDYAFERFFGAARKLILAGCVTINLLALGYFKYRNFFVENFCGLIKLSFAMKNIILPVGISFFTLSCIAYAVDRYKKETEYTDLLTFAAYVLYFPKLMSGPIVYAQELTGAFKGDKVVLSREKLESGVFRFVLGLIKKVLIADTLALYADYGMGACYYFDTLSAWVWALAYTLEIYFDFSAYSDMAIGISGMLGIDMPENFNMPYKARTVKEFWRRWHITLTRFFTKYIYIPLGGNRRGTARMIVNTVIVFFISGLWHGANWTFIIWGLLHAVAIVVSGLIHGRKKGNAISHIFTMIFVVFAWAIFRADSIETMLVVVKSMLTPSHTGFLKDLCTSLVNASELYPVIKVLEAKMPSLLLPMYEILTVIVFAVSFALITGPDAATRTRKFIERKPGFFGCLLLAILFVWCVISFSNVTTFLYFTF